MARLPMTPEEVAASYNAMNSEEADRDDDGSQTERVAGSEQGGAKTDHLPGSTAGSDEATQAQNSGGEVSAHADEQVTEPVS